MIHQFLSVSQADQKLAYENAALTLKTEAVILEKDFWVSWLLGVLFTLPEIASHLVFKGGTSLSKVFGVIERFSEDVDLSFNRAELGFGGESDPLNATTQAVITFGFCLFFGAFYVYSIARNQEKLR